MIKEEKESHHRWSPSMWIIFTPFPFKADMYISSLDMTASPRATGALKKRKERQANIGCSAIE